jgi:xylitol oxidase
MFTKWADKNIDQVWVKRKVLNNDDDKTFMGDCFGALPARSNLHPIKENSAKNCTEQLGVPGPWFDRLPHFKMGFVPSNGAELQSEFFVPRHNAYAAIMAVESLHQVIQSSLLITEIRSIAADQLWLSPAYKKDVIAIHFTWKQDVERVMSLISMIEEKLKPFGCVPHWGKLFTMLPAEIQSRYPKFDDFLALAKKMDPNGKWKNDFLDKFIYNFT